MLQSIIFFHKLFLGRLLCRRRPQKRKNTSCYIFFIKSGGTTLKMFCQDVTQFSQVHV